MKNIELDETIPQYLNDHKYVTRDNPTIQGIKLTLIALLELNKRISRIESKLKNGKAKRKL